LRETSQFPLSTTILIGSTLADWCLSLIEKQLCISHRASSVSLGIQQNRRNESWPITLIESRCSDNRDDQMGYLAIRCYHHRRWNPAHHLFRQDHMSQVAEGGQMGWQSNTPVHRAGPETDQVSSSIWSPRQHQSPSVSHVTADIWGVHVSGKHYIQVWTQAELPDCFGSATQSMKEFCELDDGT
jgi:hypothetical protein